MTTFVIRIPAFMIANNLPDEMSVPFLHAQYALIMGFPETYNSPRGKIYDAHVSILVACVEKGI